MITLFRALSPLYYKNPCDLISIPPQNKTLYFYPNPPQKLKPKPHLPKYNFYNIAS
jgi:hypothetical protein